MQSYSDFFKTLHDETCPTGYLGRGTHYSVMRAITFHDAVGLRLPTGRSVDFAVIWDEDHDVRVMEPIERLYRLGLLSSFMMFGESKGAFTAVLSNEVSVEVRAAPFNLALLRKIDEFQFSVRTAHFLSNANIIYIGDLVKLTEAELIRTPNSGRKSLNEVKEFLIQIGLRLGMDVPSWPPENPDALRKSTTRFSFLKEKVNSICKSLSDPWTSNVVHLETTNNPIIDDEGGRIALYLKSLLMLWHLGVQPEPRKDVSLNAPQAGWVIDLSEETGRQGA